MPPRKGKTLSAAEIEARIMEVVEARLKAKEEGDGAMFVALGNRLVDLEKRKAEQIELPAEGEQGLLLPPERKASPRKLRAASSSTSISPPNPPPPSPPPPETEKADDWGFL